MIRPSPEILAVARRWFRAVEARDGAAMRNILTDKAHLRFVGSAQHEIWSGTSVREGIEMHYHEAPAFKTEELMAEAFESGDVGWAFFYWRYVFEGFPDPMEARFTLVFTVEDGVWKLVQRHGSVGKPNVDIHGAEQRAIDELMQAARTGFALDQREGKAAIMFTDVADSAHLAATLGDTTWTKTIRQHLADVTQAIAAQNGRLVKSLGDGTMSMFQVPVPEIGPANGTGDPAHSAR